MCHVSGELMYNNVPCVRDRCIITQFVLKLCCRVKTENEREVKTKI